MTKNRVILLGFILAAFFLRVWRLPQTPPGLWYDEGYYGMDALWMAETNHYPPFVVGNNGRESLWPYLLVWSTSVLGNTTFALRWLGAVVGVLTVPIMYCFALVLSIPFAGQKASRPWRYWLALAAMGWLTVSWWHLHISRSGFRLVLLPPLLMLCLYFWILGVSRHEKKSSSEPGSRLAKVIYSSTFNFALAGLFLGLSQYTYLSARFAPLIFGGLVILWTWQIYQAARLRGQNRHHPPAVVSSHAVRHLWWGLFVTAVAAGLTFAPLGLFFFNNPDTFSSRTSDVIFSPDSFTEVLAHLLQSVSLFLGAGHELYRHHLPGRAMLGWLEIPFFWLGLLSLLRPVYLRRAEIQLVLLGFLVMWLPALLASPPVHALRPIGLMPFYYFIVTIGLYHVSVFLSQIWPARPNRSLSRRPSYTFALAFAVFISLSGLINGVDYFRRWANDPEVYKEYNGPLVDLTHSLLDLSQSSDILIPFHLYVHPTTRYLLWRHFSEEKGQQPTQTERPVELLLIPDTFQLLYVGNIPTSPAWVLLTMDAGGRGTAYVSRPPRADEQPQINELLTTRQPAAKPFEDRLGRTVAQFISLTQPENQPLKLLFDATPLRIVQLNWADLAQLDGYEVTPEIVRPNQPIGLNLYWHSLTDLTFDYRLFLQIVDSAGQPINQWEGEAFREDMYRWRSDGILPTQHTLWVGPETLPGPYLIRLGFFDQKTGERLPIREVGNARTEAEAPPLDQVHLGLFYVSTDGTDPRIPAAPLSANFAETIDLVGVTLEPSQISNPKSQIAVTFHWQARHATDKPYTVFLQLLNDKGEVVSGWDSQPFNGLYPTNLWSPGEIIADTFHLPLPETGLPPGAYRLIAGFYDFETGQRLPVVSGGDFAELVKFEVN